MRHAQKGARLGLLIEDIELFKRGISIFSLYLIENI